MSLTSVIRFVRLLDTTSTTGAGLTGKLFSDFTAKYLLPGGTLTSLTTETITTLGTYQAPTSSAHIRIKEVNSAAPSDGLYEVHFHNTTVATTLPLLLLLSVTGGRAEPYEVPLSDISGRIPTALGANGNMMADVRDWLGTPASTPTVAGVPNVNVKTWNDLTTVALPLVPTTAGRTLDVSAAGNAGIDWGNIENPTTAVDLSGTTIAITQRVDLNTIKTQTITCAAGVTIQPTIASQTSVDTIDDLLDTEMPALTAAVGNLPTVAQIDTQLSGTHGAGAWGSSGGAGSGAYTLTITVNDGATALENATVRMVEGANNFTATTNASGVATFAIDAATYSVAITKAGYQFTPTTKVVSATGSQTYSMSAVTITPSDPDATTGYLTVRTGSPRTPVVGATVYLEVIRFSNGSTGSAISDPLVSDTTDADGLAQFTGLPRSAAYRVRVGTTGPWSEGTTANASTTPLVNALGEAVM